MAIYVDYDFAFVPVSRVDSPADNLRRAFRVLTAPMQAWDPRRTGEPGGMDAARTALGLGRGSDLVAHNDVDRLELG